jgi:hypothetical protein
MKWTYMMEDNIKYYSLFIQWKFQITCRDCIFMVYHISLVDTINVTFDIKNLIEVNLCLLR